MTLLAISVLLGSPRMDLDLVRQTGLINFGNLQRELSQLKQNRVNRAIYRSGTQKHSTTRIALSGKLLQGSKKILKGLKRTLEIPVSCFSKNISVWRRAEFGNYNVGFSHHHRE